MSDHPTASPAPTGRFRRRVPLAELFPGIAWAGPECAELSVLDPEDERDRKAVPELDPYYVFRDTPEMRRALYAVEYPGFPCYLVGPTGCGKTTLVEQLCARLQRPVTRVNLDSGLGRSDFVGIWVFKEDQSMSFQHGPVSTAIRDGHVLILDEIDVADPGVLLLFQACLEGRPFKILETGESFAPHPDFRLFATANTVGRGDDTQLYRAAQTQNFALLDRFRWFVSLNYPTEEEERRILASRFGAAPDNVVYARLAKTAADIRRAHKNEDCEVPLSTRVVIDLAQDMLIFGGGFMAAYSLCFLNRLGPQDRKVCEKLITAVWGTPRGGKEVRQAVLAAAQAGSFEEARWLLAAWPEAGDAVDGTGHTALMFAVGEGSAALARLLLDQGADVNAVAHDGRTALRAAIERDDEALITLLLDRGADVKARTKNSRTALDAADEAGNTGLMRAARKGSESLARLLLDLGADVNAAARDGRTALVFAVEAGHTSLARLLLDRGAETKAVAQEGWTVLHAAVARGDEALSALLLDRGADVKARAKNGWTVLMSAVESDRTALAELLLDRGVEVDAAGGVYGATALIVAARKGLEAMTRLLLDRGANPDVADVDGMTALMFAAREGHEAVARLLLEQGANPRATDKKGQTAADLAKAKGRTTLAALLRGTREGA